MIANEDCCPRLGLTMVDWKTKSSTRWSLRKFMHLRAKLSHGSDMRSRYIMSM